MRRETGKYWEKKNREKDIPWARGLRNLAITSADDGECLYSVQC
jgi:hypothetical protein